MSEKCPKCGCGIMARTRYWHDFQCGSREPETGEFSQSEGCERIVALKAKLARINAMVAILKALEGAERYMTEQATSHEYPVLIDIRTAIAKVKGTAEAKE